MTSMNEAKNKLIVLYDQMAKHTLPECRDTCRVPLSCCSPEYCEMTIQHAKESWNVELKRTNHEKLPLMGDKGCTAAPHFRTMCTMHTCQINSIACKIGDPEWTTKYFEIREKIGELEELRYQGELSSGGSGGISSEG